MKKIQISKEDIRQYFQQRKKRRQEILEKRRNSAFAKRMAPIYKWMNRFSLLLHFVLACVINFVIEAARADVIDQIDHSSLVGPIMLMAIASVLLLGLGYVSIRKSKKQ